MPAPVVPGPRAAAAVRRAVLGWYEREQRDFPWRATSDPYAVLVSEVMLQQTQASRVAERFPRFLARFPTPAALAAAPSAAVLAEWSGLGYNRRAIALREAAAIVERDGWPADVTGLERLPGIGPYTARAVASLAFGISSGVVDTNVRRWLLRRFGGPDEAGALQALADALAAPGKADGRIADWTHASMELGAGVCRSRAPRCDVCPIAKNCPSRGRAAIVPVPAQAPLRGSDRAVRGAVVRLLGGSARHRLPETQVRARIDVDDERWERVMAGLERDRLVHRTDGGIALGAATIGT
jgi:A/G-specific adenine glycosylase